MLTEGYSQTPLAKKLGIKEGQIIRLINPPDYYFKLFEHLTENVKYVDDKETKKNMIHFFIKDIELLKHDIRRLRQEIQSNGSIWISWPKKSSGIVSNVSEDGIRHLALSNGLVDVKVCAIDKIWSGLKLVIPLSAR